MGDTWGISGPTFLFAYVVARRDRADRRGPQPVAASRNPTAPSR